jgi:hypothetical protein
MATGRSPGFRDAHGGFAVAGHSGRRSRARKHGWVARGRSSGSGGGAGRPATRIRHITGGSTTGRGTGRVFGGTGRAPFGAPGSGLGGTPHVVERLRTAVACGTGSRSAKCSRPRTAAGQAGCRPPEQRHPRTAAGQTGCRSPERRRPRTAPSRAGCPPSERRHSEDPSPNQRHPRTAAGQAGNRSPERRRGPADAGRQRSVVSTDAG